MEEKIKLQDITDEAIYLGTMMLKEAEEKAKKLLKANNYTEQDYDSCPALAGKPEEFCEYYLRHFGNDKECSWIVSKNYNGINDTVPINILPICMIYGKEVLDELVEDTKPANIENKDHGGYTVGKFYVYKKGGTAPKKGHKTYEDAKAEINRIREAQPDSVCSNFMIFKCVGIHYAEVTHKELKGE